MKYLLATAFVAASALYGTGGTLTPSEAWARATESPSAMRAIAPDFSTLTPHVSHTALTASGSPAYYVFNASAPGAGYAIVSADDCAYPLLGYTDSGSFDPERIPDNMAWWLSEYAAQIEAASKGAPRRATLADLRSEDFKPITPMLSTKWNQNAPFNDECPVEDKTRSVTGCSAVAMAQIMRYHHWPVSGTGKSSYTWIGSYGERQELSFDYADAHFAWSNMIHDYSGEYTEEQAAAVANIMYAAGVSVETRYHSSRAGSSADSYRVGPALAEYFKYDKSLAWHSRDFFTLSQWEEIIYGSLAKKAPVYYCGSNSDGGAHAFVCDGYSSDGFFHFNWGWGGMSDGFFRLSAADPTSQGIGGSTEGYNCNQGAIVNILPDKGTETPTPVMECAETLTAELTNALVRFNGMFINLSCAPLLYRMGARFYNPSTGESVYAASYSYSVLKPRYGYSSFNVQIPSAIKNDGVYYVYPTYTNIQNPQTVDQWIDVPTMLGTPGYALLTIADGVKSLEMPTPDHMTISGIEVLTPLYSGNLFRLKAEMTNDTPSELHEGIQALFIDENDIVCAQGSVRMIDLEPQSTTPLSYESILKTREGFAAGTYRLVFISDADETILSQPMEVEIQTPAAGITLEVDWDLKGDHNAIDASYIGVTSEITCISGYFGSHLELNIFPSSGGYNLATIYSPTLILDDGETKKFDFTGSFPNAEIGGQYFAMLYHGNTPLTQKQVRFTVTAMSGIDATEVDAEMLTLDSVWTIDGRRVATTDTSLLAPGVYILRYLTPGGDTVTRKISL